MTIAFSPERREPVIHLFRALVLLVALTTTAKAEPFQISIDEGTVNVVVDTSAMAAPYEITHMPQGQCLPEVDIVPSSGSVRVQHTRNCHGSGRNEGTVFMLKLSASQAYELRLKYGRINISAPWGENGFERFSGLVSVGGINNRRPELEVSIERRRLLGARAHFGRQDEGDAGLKTTVTYGEINLL